MPGLAEPGGHPSLPFYLRLLASTLSSLTGQENRLTEKAGETARLVDPGLEGGNPPIALLDKGGKGGVRCRFAQQDVQNLLAKPGPLIGRIGKEQHIHASTHRFHDRLFKREVIADCAHFEIIADDDAVEFQLVAKNPIDPARREG